MTSKEDQKMLAQKLIKSGRIVMERNANLADSAIPDLKMQLERNVCDHNTVITFVDARHPGCNHDAFVWQHSTAEQHFRMSFNNGKRNTWILGDSGYPLLPYLMTPFRDPSDTIETLYNEKHCKARNVVERCFGVLKNRFRCIIGSRGLHYSPEKATKIFNVCCAIHNVCIFYKNYWPPLDHTLLNEELEEISTDADSNEAFIIRRRLAESLN